MEFAFLSPQDMVVVLAIALIVFGPKRLPEVGRQVGIMIRDLRKVVGQFTDTVDGATGEVRSTFDQAASPVRFPKLGGFDTELMKPYSSSAARPPESNEPAEMKSQAEAPDAEHGSVPIRSAPVEGK